MEDKEIERLSEDLKDVEVTGEFTLEDILKEDFGDAPAPENPQEGPEPPSSETSEGGEGSPPGEEPFELPPKLSDEAAAKEYPEDEFEDFADAQDRPPRRERRRMTLPEVPNEVLILLAGMALSAVLASVAVALKLEDATRKVMFALSLFVGCVPMAVGSLGFLKDRGRVPAGLVMIVACVVTALCGDEVEAVITAVIFNLLYAVLEAFTYHELHLVHDRLEAGLEGLEQAESVRVSNQLREIEERRLRPIVQERGFDRLLLLGLLGAGVILSVLGPVLGDLGFRVWIGRAAALLAVGLYAGEASTLMNTLNAVDSCVSAGIFFADTNVMAASAGITSVLFNKAGTLTDGKFRVKDTDPVRLSEEQLIFLAAYAGAWSNHPLDKAVRLYAGFLPDRTLVERHRERPGYGTVVQLNGQIVCVGNIDLMEELGVRGDMYIPGDTCVFVAVGKTLVGRIDFSDNLRGEAAEVVNELRRLKVANVALMTGDNALNATTVGRSLGITEVYSDCRPQDRVSRLQYILDTQERDDRLAFVTTGDEDRELLEMANISVAMGECREASGTFPDILIPSAKLTRIPQAIAVAKAVRRNTLISFLISAVGRLAVAALAVTGVLTLWSAVMIVLLMEAGLFFNTRVPDDR